MKPIWIVDDDQSIRFVLEKALAAKVFASDDAKEGPEAFKAKRPPEFRGR